MTAEICLEHINCVFTLFISLHPITVENRVISAAIVFTFKISEIKQIITPSGLQINFLHRTELGNTFTKTHQLGNIFIRTHQKSNVLDICGVLLIRAIVLFSDNFFPSAVCNYFWISSTELFSQYSENIEFHLITGKHIWEAQNYFSMDGQDIEDMVACNSLDPYAKSTLK